MRKPSILIAIGLFLATLTQAQTLETVVKAWLEDAPNGFHNAFQKYGRGCGGHCLDIDDISVSYSGDKYSAFFELKAEGGDLVGNFNQIKADMENWAFLEGWESSSYVYTDHNIAYTSKKPNGEKWWFRLEVGQNYDGSKPQILSLYLYRLGIKSPKVAVPDKETLPLPGTAITSLKSRLADEKGKAALQELIAAADNDFEGIILKNSLQEGTYQVQEGHLNPKADKPFLRVVDEPQKRTLVLRFQIDDRRDYFILGELMYPPYNYNSLFNDTEWEVDNSDMWKAEHKTKPYLVARKAYEQGVDVMEIITVKQAYRKNLAANPDLAENNCIQGDCVNGFGILKYVDDYKPYRYEGGFKDGKFHGIGTLYQERAEGGLTFLDMANGGESDELLLYLGHHRAGLREGKGISFAHAKYKDLVISFREKREYFQKEENTGVFQYVLQHYEADSLQSEKLCSFTYHQSSPAAKVFVRQTFISDQGTCVSGDCRNGQGILKMEGLGNYEGRFVNGQAEGEGILKMPSGEWKLFRLHQGIPEYVRTIRLPDGVSRVAAARRGVWLLADHDCLEGNCHNGEGQRLRVSADRFRPYNVAYRGYVQTQFQNGVPQGKFTISPLSDKHPEAKGVFKNGKFDGTVIVQWPGEASPRKEYYQNGRQVTEDGQDYAEYLEEQRELWQEEYERKLLQAQAEGRARAERMRAEAEAQRRAAEKKKIASKPRVHRCSSCNGTGNYWNEVVTQDCTITYDYTYSSGKYYQTYTNCRDVTNGSYITCPVCGGDGRY